MSEPTTPHLSGAQLEAAAAGEPNADHRAHLDGCPACRAEREAIRAENEAFFRELQAAPTQADRPAYSRAFAVGLYGLAAALVLATTLAFLALIRSTATPASEATARNGENPSLELVDKTLVPPDEAKLGGEAPPPEPKPAPEVEPPPPPPPPPPPGMHDGPPPPPPPPGMHDGPPPPPPPGMHDGPPPPPRAPFGVGPPPPPPPPPPQPSRKPELPADRMGDGSGERGPKDDRMGGEEPTYEGLTAEAWVKALIQALGRNEQMAIGKARHALVAIGPDAMAPLFSQLGLEHREKPKADPPIPIFGQGDAQAQRVRQGLTETLESIKPRAGDLPRLKALIQHQDFAVRRAVVKMLGTLAEKDDGARAALESALKDRDRAVVEAAEEALKPVRQGEADRFNRDLDRAQAALVEARWAEARAILDDLLKRSPKNEAVLQMLREVEAKAALPAIQTKPALKQAEEALARGEFANVRTILEPLFEANPNDARAKALLEQVNKQWYDAMLVFARGQLEVGDYAAAKQELQAALDLLPDRPEAQNLMAQAREGLAVKLQVQALLDIARNELKAGNRAAAQEAAKKALKLDPYSEAARDLAGQAQGATEKEVGESPLEIVPRPQPEPAKKTGRRTEVGETGP
ncbi:MAG: HEAT repeat domain-containing protein [Planctomycetota bacterium]|nr:HEAT repeat domain-containing protein [Planctomycetota bacterium]